MWAYKATCRRMFHDESVAAPPMRGWSWCGRDARAGRGSPRVAQHRMTARRHRVPPLRSHAVGVLGRRSIAALGLSFYSETHAVTAGVLVEGRRGKFVCEFGVRCRARRPSSTKLSGCRDPGRGPGRERVADALRAARLRCGYRAEAVASTGSHLVAFLPRSACGAMERSLPGAGTSGVPSAPAVLCGVRDGCAGYGPGSLARATASLSSRPRSHRAVSVRADRAGIALASKWFSRRSQAGPRRTAALTASRHVTCVRRGAPFSSGASAARRCPAASTW